MVEPTCSSLVAPVRTAASLIFNPPGYEVIDAVDLPSGGRRVLVQAVEEESACPGCGVVSGRVHQWTRHRVKDIATGGDVVEVMVRKPRYRCLESLCGRRTFTQVTDQLPARARCLTRLRGALVDAAVSQGRAVDEIARTHRVAWWTVQHAINDAVVELAPVDDLHLTQIGIDEHRLRKVRFFGDETGAWRRVEPWMSTVVNTRSGQVLGVIDGRDSSSVSAWLQDRSPAWRARITVVAIDPSAPFKNAITAHLPNARISVDHFHLIQVANTMITQVRQRLAQQHHGRRGRKSDLAWAHRLLLLRGADTLSPGGWHRLEEVFRRDDPTDELGAAWGVKERLRLLLKTTTIKEAEQARDQFKLTVLAADLPEAWRLWNTIETWWPEILVLITTRVTNARTEAANTSIKQIKRTGRGYRNHDHYRARILLASARSTRRRRTLNQQATTFNFG